MILAFDIADLQKDDNFGAFCTLIILYGWAIIPFSYVFGFVFESYGNA